MSIGRYQFHHAPQEERAALVHMIELATLDCAAARARKDQAVHEARVQAQRLAGLERRLARLIADGLA